MKKYEVVINDMEDPGVNLLDPPIYHDNLALAEEDLVRAMAELAEVFCIQHIGASIVATDEATDEDIDALETFLAEIPDRQASRDKVQAMNETMSRIRNGGTLPF